MIKLFSTHCPKCDILTKKLNQNNINFTEITDVDTMISIGLTNVPILEVDGKLMDFSEANKWVNGGCR